MQLKAWIISHGMTVTTFAEKIEVSRTYLSAIMGGLKKPSKRLAKDIEEATNGDVTAKDLLGE